MLGFFAILITIIKVVVAFSLLIMIHELGHFVVAKISGVWVEEFGLGLPPRIIGKKIGDTVYSLNWLPIGGFVKLHGETSSDQVVYKDKAFTNKRKSTRILITIAGIAMNFLLAVVCFAIVYGISGIPGKVDIEIMSISPNSPAQVAGILKGDIVEKVNNIEVTDANFTSEVGKSKGKETSIELLRNGKTIDI